MCRRHGVCPSRGERLLPLVRWALESPAEVRERILAIVDDTLSWHGRESEPAATPEAEPAPDPAQAEAAGERSSAGHPAVLVAVARVLHQWSPSERILGPWPGEGGIPPL